MGTSVRIRDGIGIAVGERRFVADASTPQGDVNILSHAHGDHLYSTPPETVVCSETTAALARVRRPEAPAPTVVGDDQVALLPTGHVPGSRAALISHEDERVLYTGDLSTRDRFYLTGFEPVPADILILESTYGKPEYELPDQAVAEQRFLELLEENHESPVLAFGYTLGRAQELQLLGERSERTVYVTEAIENINRVVAEQSPVSFDVERYSASTTLGAGDMLVLPSQTNNLSFVDRIVADTGAMKIGVSGWAVESSFKYRGDYDETVALSDHCGFYELLDVVEAVEPRQVYTNHGFADSLASEIRSRLGIPAQALKQNQTTLGDF